MSVIVPTCNRAALVREALNSIYTQEGLGELFSLEVTVIDDASSDETPQVIRDYPQVRYIRLNTHRGESAARNMGIKASQGSFVAFLDDDDLWLPHKLRVQVPILERHPEVGVLYGQNVVQEENSNESWPNAQRAPSGNVFHAFLLESFISINTLLVRREAFERAGYFDERLQTAQEYDICLRLAFYVPFLFIPGDVAIMRVSTRSAWWNGTKAGDLHERTHYYIRERALAMLPDSPDNAQLKREVRSADFSTMARQLSYLAERGWIGFDRMRAHVLTRLRASPWMVTQPLVRMALAQCVARFACASQSPIRSVRGFFNEIRTALGWGGFKQWWALQQSVGDIWAEVVIRLNSAGRLRPGIAAYAVGSISLHNPLRLVHDLLLLRLIAWTVMGSRIDVIRTLLGRSRSSIRAGR